MNAFLPIAYFMFRISSSASQSSLFKYKQAKNILTNISLCTYEKQNVK